MTAAPHTLAAAVHRPLAEQLVALAELRDGESVLELRADDGELDAALHACGAAIALEVVEAGSIAPTRLRWVDGGFDVALSLLALGGGDDLLAALHEVGRVARRARIMVWEGGATHENALRAAWGGVVGEVAWPVPGAAQLRALPAGWSRSTLADVARFDSARQLLIALLAGHGLDVSGVQRAALLERFEAVLEPFTAADGTLRVPVRASLLALG